MRRLRNRSARALEGDNTSTARSSDEMSRHVFGRPPPSIGTTKTSGCTSRRGENSMSAGETRVSPSPFDSVYGLRWSYSLITARWCTNSGAGVTKSAPSSTSYRRPSSGSARAISAVHPACCVGIAIAYPRLGEGGKRTYAEDKVGKLMAIIARLRGVPLCGGQHRADSTRLRGRNRLVGSRTEHHAQKKSVHDEAAHRSHGVADQYRLTHTRMDGELR